VSPEFSSRRQALAFFAALALLLGSPWILFHVGMPSRAEVYRGVTHEAGPYTFLEHEIFEEKEDLDLVFVCSSLLHMGIDAPYVQRELSKQLGREARVVSLPVKWQGMDLQYVLLRDLLEHRHPKMVVMAMPIPTYTSDRPHVLAYRWLRYGEFPEVVEGLPLRSRVTLYADFVLGAPRQWLTLIRPNRVDPAKAVSPLLGSVYSRTGYYGAPFVEEPTIPPAIPTASMIYGPGTEARFDFDGAPLGPFQLHFALALGKLVEKYGSHLTLLHIPIDGERGNTRVPERMSWPTMLEPRPSMVGVPSAELFAGVSEERFYHYYYDQHFNVNGMRLFTRAVTPALLQVYAEHAR
jgi:hypothetical protein